MPFKSEKQRRWMHANEPEMAKRWEKEKEEEGTDISESIFSSRSPCDAYTKYLVLTSGDENTADAYIKTYANPDPDDDEECDAALNRELEYWKILKGRQTVKDALEKATISRDPITVTDANGQIIDDFESWATNLISLAESQLSRPVEAQAMKITRKELRRLIRENLDNIYAGWSSMKGDPEKKADTLLGLIHRLTQGDIPVHYKDLAKLAAKVEKLTQATKVTPTIERDEPVREQSMKITRRQLQRLVKEELSEAIEKTVVHSAGVIIIDGDRMLVLRAYQNWDFPKGTVDPGETLIDAAVRETWEETELMSGQDYKLTGGQAPPVTYRTSQRDATGKSYPVLKTATYFVAERIGNKDPFLPMSEELGKPENDEWLWVSLSELSDPRFRVRMPSRLHPVMEYVGQVMTSAVP